MKVQSPMAANPSVLSVPRLQTLHKTSATHEGHKTNPRQPIAPLLEGDPAATVRRAGTVHRETRTDAANLRATRNSQNLASVERPRTLHTIGDCQATLSQGESLVIFLTSKRIDERLVETLGVGRPGGPTGWRGDKAIGVPVSRSFDDGNDSSHWRPADD